MLFFGRQANFYSFILTDNNQTIQKKMARQKIIQLQDKYLNKLIIKSNNQTTSK